MLLMLNVHPPAGSYNSEQFMDGLVVQTLAQVYGLRDLMWEQAIHMNPSGGMKNN